MTPGKYTINDKVYIQRPLVLGQIQPLLTFLQGKVFTDLSPMALLMELGDSLPRVAAIIITPEGQRMSEKNIDELEKEFTDYLDIDTALAVAADFLSCNSLSSLSEKLRAVTTKAWEAIPKG